MVKKIFQALIRNPLLVILPTAAIALLWTSTLLLLPDINRMTDIYAGISDYKSFARSFDFQDISFIMTACCR